jgi:hypothetical protein
VVADGQNQLRPGSKVSVREPGQQGGGRGGGSGGPAAGSRRKAMSVSEPFIRRPVATSLLTVGLLLSGLLGYRQLPVSALPQVDYPTIVVSTALPGASAETMASAVTTPLERQFGQMPALGQMTSVSSFGNSQITLQFDLEPRHRRGRAGRAGRHQCGVEPAARVAAGAADLQQEQPGRLAHPHLEHQLGHPAARPGRRRGGFHPGAEDRAGGGRGPGHHQRRSEACRARAGRSRGAGRGRAQPGRRAKNPGRRQRQSAQGQPGRPAPELHPGHQRSAARASSFRPLILAYNNGAPFVCRKWPTSSTGWRTTSWPAGPTGNAPSSSTCSASRVPTSSRWPIG